MLRFTKGFRASLNLSSGKTSGIEHIDRFPGVSLTGAYKINQNEFIDGIIRDPVPPKKITPSMIKLQSSNIQPIERPSKSTNDLRRPETEAEPVDVRNSSPNISQANNNQVTKNQAKEQKNLEKKRLAEQKNLEKKRLIEQKNLEKKQKILEKKQLAEQKKRDKIAVQEQKKEEKLRKQQEQQEKLRQQQQQQAQSVRQTSNRNKKVQKRTAPQPTSQPNVPNTNPTPLEPKPANRKVNVIPQTQAYSTNTLESSISRSSGPPPYMPPETVPNTSDDTGNTRFATEKDTGSWDLITQHRQQINRPKVTKSVPKQTHLDLNYNVGSTKNNEENSEA